MDKKKQKCENSNKNKTYRLTNDGEFSLNLRDAGTRKNIMKKISQFKGFAVAQ